ncbi:DUF1428 domain-containing protein [Agrobacterium tumefaciens]|uniref:DUF1428 domain-containing protein n=1 Tax=Agrobacterium tumefaciens TaxID=358 RepID=A0AA44JAJ0_AGRTU|nr:DUF1428 domain-containing protein [Agrobacterium tumefaciens]NTB87536.1 DUF1428 domain-containing protein [Agrobacterium tumefaciens]NTC17521.1 DUF1428 domain-containing protein [Agrobacterium tumefaciens]NTC29697.1 DUF1428 domain-containing protein [Agrobacterium tumefaciens]
MTYVEGFVTAVPTANKDTYIKHAREALPLFEQLGVIRMAENWGDDVPTGKVTDFYGAVQARDDETVVFSWFEYPDKATRDAANEKMMADPRMEQLGKTMPFDGSRMIFAGFDVFVEQGDERGGYIDGFVVPVPSTNKESYRAMAEKAAGLFQEFGALRVVEAWGDDVPDGKKTDYKRATQAKDDETVVYSWIEWPDRATRDAGWQKVMADERMKPGDDVPFDGKRMFWGGFLPILGR